MISEEQKSQLSLENERQAQRLKALDEENERLQAHAVSMINAMKEENAFLIRLIRGEGSQDMIEIMEHFLDAIR